MKTEAQREAYDRWYATHREAWLAIRRQRYADNPTPHREHQKRYALANPDKIRERYERFREANPGYSGWHYRSTEQRRIGHLLRKALFGALSHITSGRDWYPNSKLGPLIGCSKPDLIAHIEALFLTGMSWENHGKAGWEIDHIRQCNAFDLTDPDQLAACFHYTNLRPLWRLDNLRRPRKDASNADV
jgi:hypothetical protein